MQLLPQPWALATISYFDSFPEKKNSHLIVTMETGSTGMLPHNLSQGHNAREIVSQ
jgi:hypothetical protein